MLLIAEVTFMQKCPSDESKSIFSGLIRVDPEAQQTNALQTNRNSFSKEAEADSLPGLEILQMMCVVLTEQRQAD